MKQLEFIQIKQIMKVEAQINSTDLYKI